ncbi:hypothetical protein Pla86_19360 [Planctomycetes bacterium Pla86]|uniref:Uncharacterized protein n=1 Tax=Engelhardtia mirabilis TaxID=2528011 RepID=A0A518BIQ9_9BACT|nr:hypothetical protein Pla133_19370 [Planctomycetes bacterium Pla133]QDV01187.1 hypothetical protein Pla86_19360 [Planctomycetes bacterium Pla86]
MRFTRWSLASTESATPSASPRTTASRMPQKCSLAILATNSTWGSLDHLALASQLPKAHLVQVLLL